LISLSDPRQDEAARNETNGKIGVDEPVEKICWRNEAEFAIRHLPAACG
jgi:hypothetical protein